MKEVKNCTIKEHLKSFPKIQWSLTALFFISFIFLYIQSGYLYAIDPSQWILDILQTQSFQKFRPGRSVGFFMNELPLLVTQKWSQDFYLLSSIFSATPWIWFIISFSFSFFYLLPKEERYLITIYPIVWSGLIIRAPVYGELMYSLVLLIPITLYFLIENKNSIIKEFFILSLLLLSSFTHQSIIFFYLPFSTYLLYKIIKHRSLKNYFARFFLATSFLIYQNILSTLNFGEPRNSNLFFSSFVSLEHIYPSLIFLFFFIGVFYLRKTSIKVTLYFLLAFSILFSVTAYIYDFSNVYYQYSSRVYIVVAFAIFSGILLLIKERGSLEKTIRYTNLFAPFFCILTIIVSISYLGKWNKYFNDLYKDAMNKNLSSNHIVYFDERHERGLLIDKHGVLAHNWTITAQSIITQLRNGETEVKQIVFNPKNIHSFEDANMNRISLKATLNLKKMGVNLSEDLKKSITQLHSKYIKFLYSNKRESLTIPILRKNK